MCDVKVLETCRGCMGSNSSDRYGDVEECLDCVELSEMSDVVMEMFTFCTNIQVTKDDGLPLNICQQCTKNIESCYNFINVCKSTDKTLHYYLSLQHKSNTMNQVKNESSDVKENPVIIDIKLENENNLSSDNEDKTYSHFIDLPSNFKSDDKVFIKPHKKKKCKMYKECNGVRMKLKRKHVKLKHESMEADSPRKTLKSSNKTMYPCPVCEEAISGRNLLIRHLNEEHEGYKRYVCKYCKKGFDKAHYLNQHEMTHSGERPYKCDVCNKTFKQSGQLSTHKRIHTKQRPYTCDTCTLTFTTKCSLTAHSKLHHGEEQHLCHLCGASFAQVGNLKVHMRVHTGEKPYTCSLCPFKCSVQSGMKRHERMHANLKSHKCPICQKGFNNNGSMVRHIRIHTGELPYKCDYCPKAFIDNWKRKNHLVKAHNIALEAIPKMMPGRRRQYVSEKPSTKNIGTAESGDNIDER